MSLFSNTSTKRLVILFEKSEKYKQHSVCNKVFEKVFNIADTGSHCAASTTSTLNSSSPQT